jgi:hypothetical protein
VPQSERRAWHERAGARALRNLERARDCYERAGPTADWHQLVGEVRAEHHRRSSFMPASEALVSRRR